MISNDLNESFAVDDAHKTRNIGNMTEGNGFPRVDSLARILALAVRGTSRVEHLHVIITVLALSNGISPLFIHQCCHTSIGLLRTFEEFVPCEAQQDLRIDRVLAHERLVIYQSLRRSLVDADRGPIEDRVRARSSRRVGHVQEI